MILTCPKCATRFFADDDTIGPAGRRVECNACGEIWSSAGVNDVVESSSRTHPDIEAATGDESATAAAPLFVERASPSRKTLSRPSRAPLVIGLFILAFAIVGLFVFQQEIERIFPGASTVYQSLGLGSIERARA